MALLTLLFAAVAQLDRASDYGSEGLGFKSLRLHHFKPGMLTGYAKNRVFLCVWRMGLTSLILFGLYTGQRLGDPASLTWFNVDLERGEIRFSTAKTGRQMILPIVSHLKRHLISLPGNDGPPGHLHPSGCSSRGRKKRVGALSRQFYDLMASTGLVPLRPTAIRTVKMEVTGGTGRV